MRPVEFFRILAWFTLAVAAGIMWYPARRLGPLDLSSLPLQTTAFAVSSVLWIVARGGRLRADPYFEFRSNVWELSTLTIAGNVIFTTLHLVLVAAILEVGQA